MSLSIGGVKGRTFHLSKGVGQGDPASTSKFLILHHVFQFFFYEFLKLNDVGILQHSLFNDQVLAPLPNVSFADDTQQTIGENFNEQHAIQYLELGEELKIITGLEINPKKTELLVC